MTIYNLHDAPVTPAHQPQRRKGADHFGYGFQVSLGKSASDGDGLWHSHGKHYHKPNTYWCGRWGDRTPEELLVECNSVIEDMRIYHPELFEATHTSPPAPEVCSGKGGGFDQPHYVSQSQIDHDAAIRKAEREKVLDELKWMKPQCFGNHEACCDTKCAWVVRERCIKSLRAQQEQPEE